MYGCGPFSGFDNVIIIDFFHILGKNLIRRQPFRILVKCIQNGF